MKLSICKFNSKFKGNKVFVFSRRYCPSDSHNHNHTKNSDEKNPDVKTQIEDTTSTTTNSKFNYLDYTAWRNFWVGDWQVGDFKPKEFPLSDFFNSKSKHTPPRSSEITEEQQQQDLKLLFFEQNALLDKALKIDPQNSLIYFEKAELLYKRGFFVEAVSLLEKALWIDPKVKGAAKLRNSAIKKCKFQDEEATVSYIKGISLFELQRYVEAKECFDATLKVKPNFKEARYNKILSERACDVLRARQSRRDKPTIIARDLGVSTHYEYAMLSAFTYKAGYLLPSGWEVLTTSDEIYDVDGNCSRDGFYAIVFVNHTYKEIAVAFQGTDNYIDLVTALHHTWDTTDRQYICAEYLAETVLKLVSESYHQFDIVFTGHSLGAAIAEYLSIKHQLDAVTFESPGVTSLLQKLNITNIANAHSLITSYLSRPNAINIARPHLGKVMRVYPHFIIKNVQDTSSFLSSLQKTLTTLKRFTSYLDFHEGIYSNASSSDPYITPSLLKFVNHVETFFKQSLHWHSIDSILAAMEVEFSHHVPFIMKEVVSWPEIETIAMYYNVTADCSNTEPDFCILGQINTKSLERAGYKVKETDPYFLDVQYCSKELIEFLCKIEKNKDLLLSPSLDKNDIYVLSQFKTVYDHQRTADGNTSERVDGFKILCGLFSYQFLNYFKKKKYLLNAINDSNAKVILDAVLTREILKNNYSRNHHHE